MSSIKEVHRVLKFVFFLFFVLASCSMASTPSEGENQPENNKVDEVGQESPPVDLSDENLSDETEEADPSLEEPTSPAESDTGFDPGTPPITTESLEEEDTEAPSL